MKLIVLNAGSGSQRCSLFDLPEGALPADAIEPVAEVSCDTTAPGQPDGKIVLRVRRGDATAPAETLACGTSTAERTRELITLLWSGLEPPLTGPEAVDAVAHRVVHGGDEFDCAVRIDDQVERAIERWSAAAPLHNPANLTGVRVARALFGPATPQCAVFDTAFHRTLPLPAATYPGPGDWLRRGIRRYGFHGTSFRWVSARAAELLGREGDRDLPLVICHLGGGCSVCATRGGRSLDTTMGFTPLDGIAMCTRSGALDPGILIHLLRGGASADELEKTLNKESGLVGLSGTTGDTRMLLPKVADGDERAILAWDVFVHRLRAGIGAMIASLACVPAAIVFTDAIGEDEPVVREAACAAFGFLGLELDLELNERSPVDADLARPGSRVRVLLVKSREAWQIARECHALLGPGCR